MIPAKSRWRHKHVIGEAGIVVVTRVSGGLVYYKFELDKNNAEFSTPESDFITLFVTEIGNYD